MAGGCRLGQLFHQYVQQTRAQNSFSLAISKRLTFLGSSESIKKGSWQFPLHQSDCHAFAVAQEGQTVHGGVIATVVEDASTMHIIANDTRGRKAVTTDLSLTYLGIGKVGRTLQIETTVLKVGGVLAVAEAQVTDISTGKLIAVGRHSMMFVGEDDSAMKFSQSMNSVFDV
ncbi:unnamed protein product [Polarella glacialis]|uniref:Thioesterase domain-containing protein n=1 Tax=Polarella glacialis TaxID=89957 RepID=A0A813G1J5_POLGL|nr:unnamed protein product [Polarella glacialis]CAE8682836.1 unnamed protein product [Polarella glacialis]